LEVEETRYECFVGGIGESHPDGALAAPVAGATVEECGQRVVDVARFHDRAVRKDLSQGYVVRLIFEEQDVPARC
jgi:hypothetical protein